MVFSSITFIFYFLPIFLWGYFFTRYRNAFLLLASLFFYTWGENIYVFLIIGSSLANYRFGLWIGGSIGKAKRRFLIAALAMNLLLICGFKYITFFCMSVNMLVTSMGMPGIPVLSTHLPLGISFFTFQAMSYLIDVYRGDAPVEKNPLNVMLYIAMFPQLIAGPIVRFQSIYDQIHKRIVTADGFVQGIRFFVIGLGQKVLIANSVAAAADPIFALPPGQLDLPLAWLGAVAYSFQIYFDFSGYSHMAIGLGLMVGFRFPENFNFPYSSCSITEFWRRWHMTLSRWFKDYLYISMGGNRKGRKRTYINLLTVFVLCGLWHGASWTFVAWGVYHGLFLVIERMGFSERLNKMPKPVGNLYTMLVVIFGWVLFRSETFSQAWTFVAAMTGFGHAAQTAYSAGYYLQNNVIIALIFGTIFSMPINRIVSFRKTFIETAQPGGSLFQAFINFTALALLLFFSVMSLSNGSYNPFIYFRF